MCWTILIAFLIVLMLIAWVAVGLNDKNETLEVDNCKLKCKLRECEGNLAMESVRLKSSEYRADRRGYNVEEL
jgi:hypothetical protein